MVNSGRTPAWETFFPPEPIVSVFAKASTDTSRKSGYITCTEMRLTADSLCLSAARCILAQTALHHMPVYTICSPSGFWFALVLVAPTSHTRSFGFTYSYAWFHLPVPLMSQTLARAYKWFSLPATCSWAQMVICTFAGFWSCLKDLLLFGFIAASYPVAAALIAIRRS